METFERRTQIWEKLRVRRKDTIANLANEFCVSKQTIKRDIDVLSREKAIYTRPGRYSGGIYVCEYSDHIKYFNESEYAVICKLLNSIKIKTICELTNDEFAVFERFVDEHTKPKLRKDVHIKK